MSDIDLIEELNEEGKIEVVGKEKVAPATHKVADDDLDALFSGLSDQLEDSKTFDQEFNDIEDGEYPTVIDQITIKLSTKGKPLASIVYKVIDGDKNGRKVWDTIWLTNRENKWSLGKLTELLQNITGKDKDYAIAAVKKLIIKFNDSGREDLSLSVEKSTLPQGIIGTLKVSTKNWVNKEGINGSSTYKNWKPNKRA